MAEHADFHQGEMHTLWTRCQEPGEHEACDRSMMQPPAAFSGRPSMVRPADVKNPPHNKKTRRRSKTNDGKRAPRRWG